MSTATRRWARLLLALLGLSALVTEIAVLVERSGFVPGNFFSFFTVEANAFAAAVLLACAVAERRTRRRDLLRGASTVFTLLVTRLPARAR